MDENLRLLERRAALGDERALRALERERIRLGRGWSDEVLVPGLRAAAARGLYLWTPPKGYAIELVYVAEADVWISKGPITGVLFRTFARTQGRGARSAAHVTYDEAVAYAKWAGLALPTAREWRAANEAEAPPSPWVRRTVGTITEWVHLSGGAPAFTPSRHERPAVRAFRLVVRR